MIMMSVDHKEVLNEPEDWSMEDEVYLLYSTLENKPVGVDKHIHMSIIWKKFVSLSKKNVSSNVIWKKLNSLYNLKYLDDHEQLPFNNDKEDFLLPVEIFPEYLEKNLSDDDRKNVDYSESVKRYIKLYKSEEDESKCKQLKGSDKMKWFESSRSTDKADSHLDESISVNIPIEKNNVVRQYGKARDLASGSVTFGIPPQLMNVLDDADESESTTSSTSKSAVNDVPEKLNTKRKRSTHKKDTDDYRTKKMSKVVSELISSSSASTSSHRIRKSPATTSETTSKNNFEDLEVQASSTNVASVKNVKRRTSTRVSEIKTEKIESSRSRSRK